MKWLILPVLWFLAACLAVFVLYRLWRGKPVVLRAATARAWCAWS